jgi:hypothetical protein
MSLAGRPDQCNYWSGWDALSERLLRYLITRTFLRRRNEPPSRTTNGRAVPRLVGTYDCGMSRSAGVQCRA